MHIDIALRFKPFSHLPGTTCLIPGTQWRVQIFPTFARLISPSGKEVRHAFSHQGPLEDFTVVQDLEKNEVRMFGKCAGKYIRYILRSQEGTISLFEDKKDPLLLVKTPVFAQNPNKERLSMGIHKKQDWEGMRRRLDMAEILPIWFSLGKRTPCDAQNPAGSAKLLEECQSLLSNRHLLETRFRHLFLAGFSGLFDPRIHDPEHQGILSDQPVEDLHGSLQLLSGGAKLIRAMFFSQEQNTWLLLPCLLPSFHAGRFVDIETQEKDLLSLEWSKGLLRRVIIHPSSDHSVVIDWPKELRHCRMRANEQMRPFQRGETLELKKGQPIFLDCFQK